MATVIAHLKEWQNTEVVKKVQEEIIDVYYRFIDFAALTQEQAKDYIDRHYN